ncbi:MAG: thioesterase [Defluviitaleaceae bacterium]|nr:thioesterase [Defluviitaleaceae bacterium]
MIYEAKKQITYNDIDANWDVTLTAILKYMTEANWGNGEQIEVGVNHMLETGLAFVIQRIAIKILKLPILGDEFTLRTWHADTRRLTFTRKGEFLDKSGHKLIEWESLWVLFDVNDRRIKRPDVLNVPLSPYGSLGVSVETEKILPVESEHLASFKHCVQFSELDTYQHMSNTYYGNLLANVYACNESRSTFMKAGTEIQFNYINEGQLGDEVLVNLNQADHHLYITGETNKHQVFAATIKQEVSR